MRRFPRAVLLAVLAVGLVFATTPTAGATPPSSPSPVPVGEGSPAVEAQRAKLAELAGVPLEDALCWVAMSIRSKANGLYVSAELGYTGDLYGMLRARSSTIGPWETYLICWDDNFGMTIISSFINGLYVAAVPGDTDMDHMMLTASVQYADVGLASLFITPFSPADTTDVFPMSLLYVNDSVVSAELGYSGGDYAMLRARASSVGPWEQFQWAWGGGVGHS